MLEETEGRNPKRDTPMACMQPCDVTGAAEAGTVDPRAPPTPSGSSWRNAGRLARGGHRATGANGIGREGDCGLV